MVRVRVCCVVNGCDFVTIAAMLYRIIRPKHNTRLAVQGSWKPNRSILPKKNTVHMYLVAKTTPGAIACQSWCGSNSHETSVVHSTFSRGAMAIACSSCDSSLKA